MMDPHSPVAVVESPLFCKDCRFLERVTAPPDLWPCSHPTSESEQSIDLVTGEVRPPDRLTARTARRRVHPGTCGPLGRFWEAVATSREAA